MIIVMCMKRTANYLTSFCSDTRYATTIQFCDNAINGDHAVRGVGLRPFVCSDCGFESRWGEWIFSHVSVVCTQMSLRGADPSSRGVLRSGCVFEYGKMLQ